MHFCNINLLKFVQIETLQPAYMASKKLQRSNLTLGDFYGVWIQTKQKLNRIGSALSIAIFNNMETRESKLLENDIFIAGNFFQQIIFKIFLFSY